MNHDVNSYLKKSAKIRTELSEILLTRLSIMLYFKTQVLVCGLSILSVTSK